MAVQFADGVIIGADSRTTTGSYIGAPLSYYEVILNKIAVTYWW